MSRLLAVLATLAVLLLAACGDDDDNNGGDTTTVPPGTIASGNVCQDNPDPATQSAVQVSEPSPNSQVQSPLAVRGQISATEATFEIVLKDADGNNIGDVTAMSQEAQVLSPFDATIDFEVEEPTSACLWVYEESAADGSPTKVVQIPVVLVP
jgi:Immunoglobulin-like domain of bacterial spore germination